MEKIRSIYLKLNFTLNTSGCYGLKKMQPVALAQGIQGRVGDSPQPILSQCAVFD